MQAPARYPHPSFRLFTACLLFTFVAYLLSGAGLAMFTDTDPLWHIAAGDLIRATGHIPLTDPWSYTAGNYHWLNIAWGWDTVMSALHEWCGWHAPAALNAITIAATIALIFTACLTRSGRLLPSLIATFSAITLLSLSLRPLQVTNLLVALWVFMLGSIVRRTISHRWLIAFPFMAILWVNTHGGFIMAPLLLGAFLLQAFFAQDKLTRPLALTFYITCACLFLNPYGYNIIEAVRRPLSTIANHFIHEWEPFTFTRGNIIAYADVFAFMLLSFTPGIKLLPIERFLTFLWCVLSFRANRYLSIFAILAAPTVACALAYWANQFPPRKISATLLKAYDNKIFAYVALFAAIAAAILLPSPGGARHFNQTDITPPAMAEEIAFMNANPAVRYLPHFNLASIITYDTHGKIPVFIDPRTETAFPPEVLRDYLLFQKGLPGWENILSKYNISGIVMPLPGKDAENDAITKRLHALPGWYEAFSGPTATIFLRQ